MTAAASPAEKRPAQVLHDEELIVRKVFRRLIPLLFVLYVFAYLDRINIGFAALSMNKELGLSPTMFGVASRIFYLGYLVCEVEQPAPGPFRRPALDLGIMITWGIASTATMFAVGPNSLYAIRLLVGIAEAGFVPGVLLYLTYWFPRTWRARATAVFLVAQPVTIAFGAALSGLILQEGRRAWPVRLAVALFDRRRTLDSAWHRRVVPPAGTPRGRALVDGA